MIDRDALARDHDTVLCEIKKGLELASGQAPMLGSLSLHHGQTIARGQTEAARAALALCSR